MDNARIHKSEDIQNVMEIIGSLIKNLTPYSPIRSGGFLEKIEFKIIFFYLEKRYKVRFKLK